MENLIEKFKALRPLKRASLILLVIQMIITLFTMFRLASLFSYGVGITTVLFILANLLFFAGSFSLAYGIVIERRSFHIVYGFGAFILASIIRFIYLLLERGFYIYSYSYSYFSGYESEYTFSFFTLLLGMLSVAAYVSMFLFSYSKAEIEITFIENHKQKIQDFFDKFWYISFSVLAFVELIAIIFPILTDGDVWLGRQYYLSLQEELYIAIFVLMSFVWKFPEGIGRKDQVSPQIVTSGSKLSFRAYCGIVQHLLLTVFTFGIWTMIWVYRMTNELNCVENFEYRSPVKKLLLFIFIPFYSMYWFYQTALRVDKLAKKEEIISDISMLSLIFSMSFPIGSMLLIQDKVNTIVLKDRFTEHLSC